MSQRVQRIGALALSVMLVGVGAVVGVLLERRWLAPQPSESAETARPEGPPPGRRGPPRAEHLFHRFQEKLSLDEEQAAKVKQALATVDEEAEGIHREVGPRMEAVMQRADDEIRGILTEQQRGAYEELVEERKTRMKKSRGRRGGFRGGPGRRGPHDRGPRRSPIDRFDANGDEALSEEELREAPGPFGERLRYRFTEVDLDKDGLLSRDELKQDRHKAPPIDSRL